MYLLQQIRAASKASEEICSYSSETKWAQKGKSSTEALFRPKSKILILGSGTADAKEPELASHVSEQFVRSCGQVLTTSVVPRLGVRLVLTVTVATSRTTTHFD